MTTMTTIDNYRALVAGKMRRAQADGFDVAESRINPMLFDWQRHIVRWALRQGRAALFEECGLGKTFQQIEWARLVAEHTGKQTLILTPLAVAHQTVKEAARLGVAAEYHRSDETARASSSAVIVANYDMLGAFDARMFGGVVLDESSILKNFSGVTRNQLIETFARTPYRLCCTATPSPNDDTELGNHAEFLGVMKRTEMLSEYFKHDGGNTSEWRLRRHGEDAFWRWVTSWAVCISKPSDIGYADNGFKLPALHLHEHVTPVDHERAFEHGKLLIDGTVSATAMWGERRETLIERCERAAAIVATKPDASWIVWCETNGEADAMRALLPEAVEVRGSDSIKNKEARLNAFADGSARIIITKPEIAAFGLNWQHCADQVFAGVTYSFEDFYQAIRRSYRFGQTRDVNANLIYAESMGGIRKALQDKAEQHAQTQIKMNAAMRESGITANRKTIAPSVSTTQAIRLPAWMN